VAAQKLGIDPTECLVIEDSHHGVAPACSVLRCRTR
jgi:beta-phosphoglucomutase-like phosphatase (HAD superfamily)